MHDRLRASMTLMVPLMVLLIATSGCRGSDGAHGDSVAAGLAGAGHAPLSTPTAGASDTATLATPRGPTVVRGDSAPGATAVIAEPLQWTADAVILRLRQGGLAPVSQGAVQQAAFGAPGLRVSVANGAGEVQAYVFGDAGAVGVATRRFDAGALARAGRTATLSVDNNLAAIVMTGDERLRARIQTALVARRGEGR